ncbi:MAG: hypothetical protein IPL28_00365 [Chloroflexi bacterium]|nr:hypothetical protein [Chloroflexota bacterium]
MKETAGKSNNETLEDDPNQDIDALFQKQTVQTNPNASLRDAFLNMFNTYNKLEQTIADSKDKLEIIVWPIAVYRELILND